MLTRFKGDNFAVYTNIKSLCCTSKTKIMLFFNYASVKKNKNTKKIIFNIKVLLTFKSTNTLKNKLCSYKMLISSFYLSPWPKWPYSNEP